MVKDATVEKKNVKEIVKKIIPVLKKHDVARAGIFGSQLRGEAKEGSDVDILIKFKGRKSLLDFVGLKIELEEELKRKVDVVEYSAIHPLLRKQVLKEQLTIMGRRW